MTKVLHQPLGGNKMPRFGGPATMMRLPMLPSAQGLDVCFVGVPCQITPTRKIQLAGAGYTLVASAPGLTSATTLPFNVTGASTIVITPSAPVINYRSSVTFTMVISSSRT